MHTNTHIITNGLDLGEDRQGKGRYFTSKFLEPGLAKYDEPIGTILLDKETIDKFITSFKGCPVIIDHKDITDDTAKDERVGVVSNVWYNAEDGWYYCDGVIFRVWLCMPKLVVDNFFITIAKRGVWLLPAI